VAVALQSDVREKSLVPVEKEMKKLNELLNEVLK